MSRFQHLDFVLMLVNAKEANPPFNESGNFEEVQLESLVGDLENGGLVVEAW